jgi:chromate transporter
MENLSLKQQFKLWTSVALQSFGGPAGQIAVIHRLVVEEKKLISEEKFLHALNFCMLLPGPEAQQLATYIGWLIHKTKGGLIAGLLFILPGFLSILTLSYFYVLFYHLALVQGLFYGLKPAILVFVTAALFKISQRVLKNTFHLFLAIGAFIALFFFNLAFPVVVIFAGLSGIIYARLSGVSSSTQPQQMPQLYQTFKTFSLWSFVWIFPIFLTHSILGEKSTLHTMNIFFSKMSMLTFGGAYAALSYVAQEAVATYGWVSSGEMLDALAMAESTPGPLIQSVQFVGFLGAYRFHDFGSPMLSAFLASILVTWMTFAPCFLWIFTFAPYVEFIRGKKIFAEALNAITASVVGVILNLSLWFILKTIFKNSHRLEFKYLSLDLPILNSIDPWAVLICLLACVLRFRYNKNLFIILGSSALLGALIQLFSH